MKAPAAPPPKRDDTQVARAFARSMTRFQGNFSDLNRIMGRRGRAKASWYGLCSLSQRSGDRPARLHPPPKGWMTKTIGILPACDERVRKAALWAGMLATFLLCGVTGCAHVGRLSTSTQTLTPVDTTGGHHPERALRSTSAVHPMFGPDTLVGFQPGTGDSSRRYLGRLRHGLTADTLNIILLGDNRPSFRSTRIEPELLTIEQGLSPNPVRIGKAVGTIPIAFFKGMYPDLGLVRDIPAAMRKMPTYGREHQVLNAILAKIDTLNSHHKMVAAVINTGDLVYDGRRPAHWERFLRITEPLSSRVPYFAVAGNHEQTWTEEGVDN